MSENNDKILEQLICPVCLAHPEKEVFQCQSGHPICSSCIQQLENCPQCKIPFGFPRSRCRLMESLLDSVKLPCVNKGAGCTQQFLRKDMPDHQKTCEFRSVSFCKWMGYDCSFQASAVEPLIQHLESCHDAKKWTGVVWKNFEKQCDTSTPVAPFRTLLLREFIAAIDEPQQLEKIWILFLVRLTVEPNQQRFASIVPILLQDGRTTAFTDQVHIDVFTDDLQTAIEPLMKRMLISKWSASPSKYKDAEEDILYPIFRLSTNYIMKQVLRCSELVEFDLRFHVSVIAKSIQNDENSSQSFSPIVFSS